MSPMTRPKRDEFDPYYADYIAKIESDDVVEAFRRQQAETESVLMSVSEDDAGYRYAAEKWSVKEVVGHMSDTERVFQYRALCIARGESQSLPGMDQDVYVSAANFDRRDLASLAEEFAAVRSATISLFESLDSESWDRRGVANEVEVTVRALAFIIAGHEAHHMAILRERYRVGE